MTTKSAKKLGKNMKHAREVKQMSQGDIARALGVDKGYVSNLENAKRNPTLATVEKLAEVLRVSVSELLK
jgi:transcriptional regulator with XRE-family HTH domain